jgi:hypothetical protein
MSQSTFFILDPFVPVGVFPIRHFVPFRVFPFDVFVRRRFFTVGLIYIDVSLVNRGKYVMSAIPGYLELSRDKTLELGISKVLSNPKLHMMETSVLGWLPGNLFGFSSPLGIAISTLFFLH